MSRVAGQLRARELKDSTRSCPRQRHAPVRTGDIVATSRTGANGDFLVAALDPGSYVVEIVDVAGRIIGVRTIATVAEGRTATLAVTVAATHLVGGLGAIAITSIVIASGLGIAGIVVAVTGDEASPSQ